jgi:hypothetical protein
MDAIAHAGLGRLEVVDAQERHVGVVATTWPLDGGGEAELALLKVGRRLPTHRYVPLWLAAREGDRLRLEVTLAQIQDAPSADDHRWGDPAHVARAYWRSQDD